MVHGFKYAFVCLLNVRQGSFQLWLSFKREVLPKKKFYKMLEIISYPKHMCFFLWGKFEFNPRDCGFSITLMTLVSTTKQLIVICF